MNKKRLTYLVITLLLAAIPLTLYLIRQQQILRGRAQEESSITFPGLSGNPPATQNQNVQLKLTYGQVPGGPPPPPPPPASSSPSPSAPSAQGTLTATSLPSQTGSDGIVIDKIQANWSNLASPYGTLYLVHPFFPDGENFLEDITTSAGSYTYQFAHNSPLLNQQVRFRIKRDNTVILTSNAILVGSGSTGPPPPPPAPPPPPPSQPAQPGGDQCSFSLTDGQILIGNVDLLLAGIRTNPLYYLSLQVLNSRQGSFQALSSQTDLLFATISTASLFQNGQATLECRIQSDPLGGTILYSKSVIVNIAN